MADDFGCGIDLSLDRPNSDRRFRIAEIRAESAALAFEVILGEPDFFMHLMLETSPEQRFE